MKKKNKIIAAITILWAVLSALNESGLLDVMPIDNETIAKWIKWGVAIVVVVVNAVSYRGVNGGFPAPADQPNPDHEEH